MYEECSSDLVESFFEGYNATIFAYGQTGSGKTFTMGSSAEFDTNDESRGIIPRVIQRIFEKCEELVREDNIYSYTLRVQFFEIYGEEIRDLLNRSKSSSLVMRESLTGEVYVSGACELFINSLPHVMTILEQGCELRTTGSTVMNQTSSRSHAVFTILLEQTIPTPYYHSKVCSSDETALEAPLMKDKDFLCPTLTNIGKLSSSSGSEMRTEVRKSKFHFVDLAGSERAKRTGAEGYRMKEGIDINKGLLALGNVISALGDDNKRGKVHVPYRDSKLTRMLQNSLGGNSKTLMICCVSPAQADFVESLNAIRYAHRARNIKNKPVVNRDPTSILIADLRHQIQTLANDLLLSRNKIMEIDSNLLDSCFSVPHEEVLTLSSLIPYETMKGHDSNSTILLSRGEMAAPMSLSSSSTHFSAIESPDSKEMKNQILNLRQRLNDSEVELKKVTEAYETSKLSVSELTDRIVLLQSELEYFKIKIEVEGPDYELVEMQDRADARFDGKSEITSISSSPSSSTTTSNTGPAIEGRYFSSFSFLWGSAVKEKGEKNAPNPAITTSHLQSAPGRDSSITSIEKKDVMNIISKYLRQIEELKQELKETKKITSVIDGRIRWPTDNELELGLANDELDDDDFHTAENEEFLSTVDQTILQTQKQLKLEEDILLRDTSQFLTGAYSTIYGNDNLDKGDLQEENEEEIYQSRQRSLAAEVFNLNESIRVKEELVKQLQVSQERYAIMQNFYNERLESISKQMEAKQEERQALQKEIDDLIDKTCVSNSESRLRAQLAKKDEELKGLRRKYQKIISIPEIQKRYSEQQAKLEDEMVSMKRERVGLSRTLAKEKRLHAVVLKEKAKEIERLKKLLSKRNEDVKKLSIDKDKADIRAKESIREGIVTVVD